MGIVSTLCAINLWTLSAHFIPSVREHCLHALCHQSVDIVTESFERQSVYEEIMKSAVDEEPEADEFREQILDDALLRK